MPREDTQFKPGNCANPKGRPKKGETLTDALAAKLDKDMLADKLLAFINDGNFNALKYAYDRVDGRPKETIVADVNNRNEVDLSRYTAEELKQLAELNRKSRS